MTILDWSIYLNKHHSERFKMQKSAKTSKNVDANHSRTHEISLWRPEMETPNVSAKSGTRPPQNTPAITKLMQKSITLSLILPKNISCKQNNVEFR